MEHKKTLKSFPLFILVLVVIVSCGKPDQLHITSPDQMIRVMIDMENGPQYWITFGEDTILKKSRIQLILQKAQKLEKFELLNVEESTVNEAWERVWGKRKHVTNHYNALIMHLREQDTGLLMDLYFRAYNDGVGIRYGFPEQENLNNIVLKEEKTEFSFTNNHQIWRADYQTYKSSQEQEFLNAKLSDISNKYF